MTEARQSLSIMPRTGRADNEGMRRIRIELVSGRRVGKRRTPIGLRIKLLKSYRSSGDLSPVQTGIRACLRTSQHFRESAAA
jgi:hypothetical protein